MNVNSIILKFLKLLGGKIPRIRNSVIYNTLNLTIPRKFKLSGHFHLNTLHYCLKVWGIIAYN